MGQDEGYHPVPRSLDIQQHLKRLRYLIGHVPVSSEDSERQAEARRKHMELIRQQVYETLAPVNSPQRGLDDWELQRPSGSTGPAKPPRPCWGNLLTCLQTSSPHSLHQGSFETPALKPPCRGYHCDRNVQTKPLRRPMYTIARPSGGIHRHKNTCKYNQPGCHHNRILPTFAPIRLNRLPTRNFFTTTSPASNTSNVKKKQQSATNPSQTYFTLPDKFYNLAVNPTTTPSVTPKDLRDDSTKLENEILGITTRKQFDLGLKTESSVRNDHSYVIGVTTQSHIAKNDNVSTAKTIIMSGNFPSSDNDATTQPSYISKNTSSQTKLLPNITFISNRTYKSEGDLTTPEIVTEMTTVTQRMVFYEDLLTTQVRPSNIRPPESKVKLYVPYDHLSPMSSGYPASEHTPLRTEIHDDYLTTQVSLLDSTSPKSKEEPKNPVSPNSAVYTALQYTTFRTTFDEALLTTQINPMSSEHQESKSKTLPDVDHLSLGPVIYSDSEYTAHISAPNEDLLTSHIIPIDTTSNLESKIELLRPVEHSSTDAFNPSTSEFSTLATSFDEVPQTTRLIPLVSLHQDSAVKTDVYVNKLISEPTISSDSKNRDALNEDLLTTQVVLVDTKVGQEGKIEPIQPNELSTTGSFISSTTQYPTLRTEPDEVLVTRLISEDIEPDNYPITDSSLHKSFSTTWKTEDNTIRVGIKENDFSKAVFESPKHILSEEDLQSSESTTPNVNISRGDPNIYLTTKMTEDSSTPITDVHEKTDVYTIQTTEVLRVAESDTTGLPLETTTIQFDSKTDKEQILYKGAKGIRYDPTTNVSVEEDITDIFSFNQDHINYEKERSAFSDLENGRSFQDDVWKFTTELDNYDDRFANDEGAIPTYNNEIARGQRLRREVSSELKLELNQEALINHSSLPFTTRNNSTTFNTSNIVELWPIIREGLKNYNFTEEDKKVIRSIYGLIKPSTSEDASSEIMEPELLGDGTSRIEEDRGDYEYYESTKEEIRNKRARKTVTLGKNLVRLSDSLRNNLTTSFIRTSRGKRSAGVEPVSEAAAFLALLAEGGGAVQLDRATDVDDDNYEYYGYDDDEEYGDQYEDKDEEYDDSPSFKELIVLANRHRKRKEAKS